MKKLSIVLLAVLLSGSSILMTGCYGSFELTKKVYDFNGSLGNKFINEVVFLAFCVVPVYEVSLFIDGVILNLVEFWTGSNPLSLHQGENKVNIGGQDLTILLENNKATIFDNQNNELTVLSYNTNESTWYATSVNGTQKLMKINENTVDVYTAAGDVVSYDKDKMQQKSSYKMFNDLVAVK